MLDAADIKRVLERKIQSIRDSGLLEYLPVEDNQFELAGFEMPHAEDGENALRMIKESKPNIVLLDIVLPKMSGFDVLKQLKAGGYKVVQVDVDNHQIRDFIYNTRHGPASRTGSHPDALERPFDVKFGPDGAMYVLDIGRDRPPGSPPG